MKRMRKNYIAFVGFVLLFLVFSGKKEQEIPSYLFIPAVNTNGIYSISGSDSSKIYGAKVFVNNQLIGVYQTPVEVPVFAEGDQKVQIVALIENYGFSDALIPYPFYDFTENSVFLSKESTAEVTPVVDYLPTTNVIYWFEDFELPGMKFINDPVSTSEFVITNEEEFVYEQNGSGLFDLDNDSAFIRALTDEGFRYTQGSNAFVELHYKNNQPFFFSLVLKLQSGQIIKVPRFQFKRTIVEETGEFKWNKLYLEIGSRLNVETQLKSFEISFEMERDISVANPFVLIDNVKLIRNK